MAKHVMPRAIRRKPDAIEIDWDGEGHTGVFPARALRLRCPCAGCVDEMSGRPVLVPATVPDNVAADAVELVGGYALRVHWSDGHSTGIYPFEMLYAECPCERCREGGPLGRGDSGG